MLYYYYLYNDVINISSMPAGMSQIYHRPPYKVLNYDNQLWHAEGNVSLYEGSCYEIYFNS